MRFLVDESTGPAVASWLEQHGHDVFSVYAQARGMDDRTIMEIAANENRIVITGDRKFGEKIFRERRLHPRVVFPFV